MWKLIPLLLSLMLFGGCKIDDEFVVGGGPDPGNGINSDISAEEPVTRLAETTGDLETNGDLASDISEPIIFVAGDTLLLLGGMVNKVGARLPASLNNTALLDGVTATTEGVAGVLNNSEVPVDSLRTGVVGTVGDLTGDLSSGGDLLGSVSGTVGGLTGDLSSSGDLLGGVTGTVNGVTGSLVDGDPLSGVTAIAEDSTGAVTGSVESGTLSENVTTTVDDVTGVSGLAGSLLNGGN